MIFEWYIYGDYIHYSSVCFPGESVNPIEREDRDAEPE